MIESPRPAEPAPAGAPGVGDIQPDWPERTADAPLAADPAVEALLEPLDTLAHLPVADHGDVYAALHDELADALNEDVTGEART